MKTQSKQISRIKLVKEGSNEHYSYKEDCFEKNTFFDICRYPKGLIEDFKSKFNPNDVDLEKMKEYVVGLDIVSQIYIISYILNDMSYEFYGLVGQKEFSEIRHFLSALCSENYKEINAFLEKNDINCVMLHDCCLGISLDNLDENGNLCESGDENEGECDFEEDFDNLSEKYKKTNFTLKDMLQAYESGGMDFDFVNWIRENFEAKI